MWDKVSAVTSSHGNHVWPGESSLDSGAINSQRALGWTPSTSGSNQLGTPSQGRAGRACSRTGTGTQSTNVTGQLSVQRCTSGKESASNIVNLTVFILEESALNRKHGHR